MERLNTTSAEATSVEFLPAGDVILQVDSAVAVTVDVEVRMDSSLNWAGAMSYRSDAEPVVRIAQVPSMRLKIRGNTVGNAVKIWDNT